MRPAFRLLGLCAVVGALLAHRQPLRSPEFIDSILAVVEGQVIMSSDVRAFLAFGLMEPPGTDDSIRPMVVTKLIQRRLVLDEVDRYALEDPPAAEVAERMNLLIERVGGSASLNMMLTAVGYTQEDLEQVLRDDLRIASYLSGRFPVARQPTAVEVVARQDLIDAWAASLINRANVIRVKP